MIRIKDKNIRDMYIEKYNIDKIFSTEISDHIELVEFKKNEYICRENEAIDYIFFYVKGKAKVYTTLSNGKALLLCIYTPFKIIGDLEFIDNTEATTNLEIIEDSYCLALSLDKFRNVLLDDNKFLKYILASVGSKLNRLSKNSAINLLYPLENRLASYIVATMNDSADNDEDKYIFNENLSQVSELLGTSYRHLLRVIQALCKKEIMIKNKGNYEIKDYIQLKELALDLYEE